MIIDGRQLAHDLSAILKDKVSALSRAPQIAIISIAPDFATEKYLAIKRTLAERIGVRLHVVTLEAHVTTEEVMQKLEEILSQSDGVVLQLPYPRHINTEALLALLPREKDPDAIGAAAVRALREGDCTLVPPVVAAILHIAEIHNITFTGKNVVIIGKGRLVGSPMEAYLRALGVTPTVLTKSDGALDTPVRAADILILGAGVPGLITPSMIQEGVVIFDAGTSEEGGKLVGDADPLCAEKASLFTPVPRGIGPLAVVKLLENQLKLHGVQVD